MIPINAELRMDCAGAKSRCKDRADTIYFLFSGLGR